MRAQLSKLWNAATTNRAPVAVPLEATPAESGAEERPTSAAPSAIAIIHASHRVARSGTPFVIIVDIVSVVSSFVPRGQQGRLLLRLVHSRWAMGVCDLLYNVQCVPAITNAQLRGFVAAFPEVRTIDLAKCSRLVVAEAVSDLSGLGGLATLKLVAGRGATDLHFTDAAAELVGQIATLTSLDISCDRLSDKGLELLASLPRLTSLSLRGGNITDTSLAIISGARSVTSLELAYCNAFTDAGLDKLARLPRLSFLGFYACASITNASVAKVSAIPSLRQLKLGDRVLSVGR